MTVSSEDSSIEYAADGVTADFAIPFPFFSNAHIRVSTRDSAGDTTTLATGFTITGEGTGSGNCNLDPVLDDVTLVIERVPTFLQQSDYVANDRFPAETNESDHDRGVLISQYLYRLYQGCVRFPIGDASIGPLSELPSVSARKSKNLGFDSQGRYAVSLALASGTLSADSIAIFTDPRTAAEISAAISPVTLTWKEGDIRRYGALTAAADNSAAIRSALLVSAAGGPAAHIPGGTWALTSAVVVPAGSSMYGHGKASVISVANGVDGLQLTATDAGIVAQPRFFRDFRVVGTLSGTTNAAKGININAAAIDHTTFQNIAILNFQYGMYCKGLYYCTIQNCWIQNCYHGIFFQDQSVNVYCLNNTIQYTSAGTLITAAGYSDGISCQGAPEIEGLHIQGGSIYGFDYDIKFGLIFECQIEAVDISFAKKCPILFASTIGGMVIRDCWIEMAATSGTFNDAGTATGHMTGIFVAAISLTVNAKVHICDNYIVADTILAGSCGVFAGNGNVGLQVTGNHIIGFDVGIGGGATNATALTNVGGASSGAVYRDNTINCVRDTTTTGVYSATSGAILVNSLGADMTVGPNWIVEGTGAAATIAASTTVTVPTQATAGSQQFPVGTPVRCTITRGNADSRVTYYVLTSSGASLTLAATPGGAAITWTGTGSIGSLVQSPLPINYSALTPPGVTFYGRGAFQITLSDPALSGTVLWQASGKMLSLYPVAALTDTSGAAAQITATGLPTFLAPTTTQNAICGVESGGVGSYGMFQITANAAITIATTPLAGSFSGSGTKGLLNTAINLSFA